MTTAADLHAARAEYAAWQRTDEEAAHDRDPRRVRVMRIVAAERVRLIEQLLAMGTRSALPHGEISSVIAPEGTHFAHQAQRRSDAALRTA